MIKALLFDLGGVLIDLDFDGCLEYFRDELGYADIVNVLDKSHHRGHYALLEEGLLPADDFRKMIVDGSKPGTVPSDVDKGVWKLLSGIAPYKAAMLEKLSRDYTIFMLSNNNPISMPRCRQMMSEAGIDENRIFAKEFLSWEMRMLKPSREIYLKVIEGMGFEPSEVLFIDDSMVNIKAAEAVGLRGLYYDPKENLESLIDAYLKEDSAC